MKWITRERPKIDRIACPWLIARFVDDAPDFLYVPSGDVVQVVLKAMRSGGINIVAIHQHMTNEQPRYMFLHYWGKGKATELAASIKKALDAQAGVHRP